MANMRSVIFLTRVRILAVMLGRLRMSTEECLRDSSSLLMEAYGTSDGPVQLALRYPGVRRYEEALAHLMKFRGGLLDDEEDSKKSLRRAFRDSLELPLRTGDGLCRT